MDEALFSGGRFTRLARLRELLEEGALEQDLRWREPATIAGAR
jgi:hypothetical protein